MSESLPLVENNSKVDNKGMGWEIIKTTIMCDFNQLHTLLNIS